MSDKRVSFKFGPMQIVGADGLVLWEHNGQTWYNLPQAGAVFIQSLLVDLEDTLTRMGEIVAQGGTVEEQMAKAAAAGLIKGGKGKN